MTRIYQNFLGGRLDSDHTDAVTTLTAAALTSMQAVASPDEMIVVIDPDGLDGAPEAVIVTAHTAAAGTGTMTRGALGTTARAHNAGTRWVHPMVDEDVQTHAAKLWRSSAYTLSGTGVDDPIEFDTEVFDLGDNADTADGTYNAPFDGVYHVDSRVQITAPSTERFIIHCEVNGTAVLRGTDITSGTNTVTLQVSGLVAADSGQDIRITVQQVSGTARALELSTEKNAYFSIFKVNG